MNGKSVQRTAVFTFGPLAVAAGEALERRLAADGQPTAAVVLVAGEDVAGPDGRERLAAAIEAVSRASLRRDLARGGWTLDRLDELGLVVLVDATMDAPDATAAVEYAREVARARLGIDVGALALALCPEPGGDGRNLLRRLLSDPIFDRGVVALSRTRLDGLCLESVDSLILAAADLVQALIATPLRDAPADKTAIRFPDNWEHVLAPQPVVDDGDADGLAVLSMGIARWTWSAAATRALLAQRWTSNALDGWLAEPAADLPTLNAQAFGWLEKQGVSPETLVAQADELVPASSIPLWHAPQPWRVRAAIEPLRSVIWPDASVVPRVGGDPLAERVAQWGEATRVACRDMLQRYPTGGLTRTQKWIDALQVQSALLVERAAARQERESETAIELARQAAVLETTLNALLDIWPPDDLVTWLPFLARPWRWLRLALTYAALNRAGRALRELAAGLAALARERAITTILLSTYARWNADLERLGGHLEEMGEMLRFVRDGLAAAAPEATAPPALYDRLTVTPQEEAARAATAVGGLGCQLDALDDGFVAELLSAGWERFAAVEELDAVAVLPAFFPADGAVAWWQDLHDGATPLWPASAGRPAHGAATAVVLSPDPLGLRAWVGESEAEAARWLPGLDSDSIVLVRLATVVI